MRNGTEKILMEILIATFSAGSTGMSIDLGGETQKRMLYVPTEGGGLAVTQSRGQRQKKANAHHATKKDNLTASTGLKPGRDVGEGRGGGGESLNRMLRSAFRPASAHARQSVAEHTRPSSAASLRAATAAAAGGGGGGGGEGPSGGVFGSRGLADGSKDNLNLFKCRGVASSEPLQDGGSDLENGGGVIRAQSPVGSPERMAYLKERTHVLLEQLQQQEQVYTKKQDDHTDMYTNSCAPTR